MAQTRSEPLQRRTLEFASRCSRCVATRRICRCCLRGLAASTRRVRNMLIRRSRDSEFCVACGWGASGWRDAIRFLENLDLIRFRMNPMKTFSTKSNGKRKTITQRQNRKSTVLLQSTELLRTGYVCE